MNTIVPIPLWALLCVMGLMCAWQIATAVQSRALRDLWKMYWKAQHGSDDAPSTLDELRAQHAKESPDGVPIEP